MKHVFLLAFSFCFLLISCKSDKNSADTHSTAVENDEKSYNNLQSFLKSTMDAHGGEENYKSLGSIHWSQAVRLFDTLGIVRKERTEYAYINIKNNLKGNIAWIDSSLEHRIDYIQGSTYYYINGYRSGIEDLHQQAGATYFTTYSSVFAPFNLRTFQTKLQDKGMVSLTDFGDVRLIEGRDPLQGLMSKGSSKLKYYFNQNDQYVAMEIDSGEEILRMFHEGLLLYKGLKLPEKTTSYLISSKHEKPIKLSEIEYNYGDR